MNDLQNTYLNFGNIESLLKVKSERLKELKEKQNKIDVAGTVDLYDERVRLYDEKIKCLGELRVITENRFRGATDEDEKLHCALLLIFINLMIERSKDLHPEMNSTNAITINEWRFSDISMSKEEEYMIKAYKRYSSLLNCAIEMVPGSCHYHYISSDLPDEDMDDFIKSILSLKG